MRIMIASRERDLSASPARGPQALCLRAFFLVAPARTADLEAPSHDIGALHSGMLHIGASSGRALHQTLHSSARIFVSHCKNNIFPLWHGPCIRSVQVYLH
jgi:hypothetical protein